MYVPVTMEGSIHTHTHTHTHTEPQLTFTVGACGLFYAWQHPKEEKAAVWGMSSNSRHHLLIHSTFTESQL